jgi:hypothetical protein
LRYLCRPGFRDFFINNFQMKKRKGFTRFIALVVALLLIIPLLNSCKTTSYSEKERMLIGKWRVINVEMLTDNNVPPDEKQMKTVNLERRTSLEIKEDKTAVKKFPGTTLEGKWQLKGNGSKLVAKDPKSLKKIRYKIVKLTPDQAIVENPTPLGTLKITYQKEK